MPMPPLAHALRNQAATLRRVLSGGPAAYPPLANATLDLDDVETARAWLRRPETEWDDEGTLRAYEGEFAGWNGSRHAFAFAAGRVALWACLRALGLRAGDEVVLPGYTCVVVPNALRNLGLVPVYADVELETYGLDAASVEARITPRTRAILLHHLYGLVCRDYDAILDLAARRGIPVIEDCAHATGATHRGVRVGNRGAVAFYSSERSKAFSTIRGGVAVTNDDALAAALKDLREGAAWPSAGRTRALLRGVVSGYYESKHPRRWLAADYARVFLRGEGVTSTTPAEERGAPPEDEGMRMPAPLADVGRVQIRKLDAYNERRRQTARRWDAWCDERGYARPRVLEGSMPTFLRYPVLVEPSMKRDLSWARRGLRVQPGVWFTSQLHPVPGRVEGCPNAAVAVERCINLPGLVSP